LTSLRAVNETFSELFASASERTVTIRTADGHALVRAKLLHAAAAAVAGVIVAPRITAAAAMGALLKGITVTVDGPSDEPAAA